MRLQYPAAAPVSAEEELHAVKSPIVGTFYEAPGPGAPPFVNPGDQVDAGQVLCIVEAMKLMNEIESDVSGEIVKSLSTTANRLNTASRCSRSGQKFGRLSAKQTRAEQLRSAVDSDSVESS